MQISLELTAILSGAIMIIFWLAGVHFSTVQNKKDIATLWSKHDAHTNAVDSKLGDISRSLARIEGRLSVEKE